MANGHLSRFNSTMKSARVPEQRRETRADKEKKMFPVVDKDIAKLQDWVLHNVGVHALGLPFITDYKLPFIGLPQYNRRWTPQRW